MAVVHVQAQTAQRESIFDRVPAPGLVLVGIASVQVGAAFATIETALILARLVWRFDFETLSPETVRPYARLTTRPAVEIRMRVRRA